MLEYKNPFCIRGTHLNCPLPLTLESYWACEADCFHCLGRKLNQIWGEEQRAASPEKIQSKLKAALKNKKPKTSMAVALSKKKVIWIGRKSDPYQPIENELKVTRQSVQSLLDLSWPFLICSRYISNANRDLDLFVKAKDFFTFLVEVTPGGEGDWELFERKRTTAVKNRLKLAKKWVRSGVKVGIRGEPFIPGYHSYDQFRDILKLIKSYGFKSYNTYNLHMNDYTLKRLLNIGLDIEKIWTMNQDYYWKDIQKKLCEIADEENIILGCPDFVNTPKGWRSKTNTCCGVNVPAAFTFNTHTWKIMLQAGVEPKKVLMRTFEGICSRQDFHKGDIILTGRSRAFYTMGDANL